MENFAYPLQMLQCALKYFPEKSYPYASPLLWSHRYVKLSVISTTRLYIESLDSIKECNEILSSTIDSTKTVYIIVHGQNQLFDQVQEKLVSKGFEKVKMQKASLDKVGNPGEYVAMAWPPMNPNEIVISEITGSSPNVNPNTPVGAWASVEQKELDRL